VRSGVLSFLAGILLAQQLTGLPELWYAPWALAGLAAIAVPRLRIAAFVALGFLWAVWRATSCSPTRCRGRSKVRPSPWRVAS
jgi:hypothetical protein